MIEYLDAEDGWLSVQMGTDDVRFINVREVRSVTVTRQGSVVTAVIKYRRDHSDAIDFYQELGVARYGKLLEPMDLAIDFARRVAVEHRKVQVGESLSRALSGVADVLEQTRAQLDELRDLMSSGAM